MKKYRQCSTGYLSAGGLTAESLTTKLESTDDITAVGTFGSLPSTSLSTGQTSVFGLEGDAQVTIASAGSIYIGACPSSTITGESYSTGGVKFGGGGTCNVNSSSFSSDGCQQEYQSPPTISPADIPSGMFEGNTYSGWTSSAATLAGADSEPGLILATGAIALGLRA